MQKTYKNFVFLGLLPFVLMYLFFAWLYLYDPLQLFHKPFLRDETFLHDLRSQNRGIIENYDFNSVILGTSMLENTLPKDANEILQNLVL
ncbi:hypothetical protein DCO58_07180 [Helicobacter saguini]|uniref:Uncharacterized protein n=1 Tax=Helicobacter saguini TaxID=1548018 RepID=A0A347VN66_9HELI|nr:hypothetical protein [Helicobacter saguini]MWV61884.1 hypothetical protein [Helicobacter saguini]MWV67441.1 hypothetical protein [Helicobacter saguini]MWV69794.1 hypothetical protein [Helicobacter saguini]MWV72989.1 hypothetical protein [Helicobacter saguini]TLD95631.1 hypothetical protein LS64_001900 [Helicobacter saguini]